MEFPDISKIPFLRGIGAFAFISIIVAPSLLLFFLVNPKDFNSMDLIRLIIISESFGLTNMVIALVFSYITVDATDLPNKKNFNQVPLFAMTIESSSYICMFLALIFFDAHKIIIPFHRLVGFAWFLHFGICIFFVCMSIILTTTRKWIYRK